ncbi:hypothetical protein Cni_G21590 [Canna indica]|uniref:DUF506 family protein n=1 Tax=Canna indica TaxID=4628 RepID=A0AAQ3KPU2_9LILI|nr:hypothetical protein Cni_G21590 [Canna indica]
MEVYARTKRVTAPLGEEAKARIRWGGDPMTGYASSGSEHDAFSSLVHAFFECDDFCSDAAAVQDDEEKTDSDGGDPQVQAVVKVREMVRGWREGDAFRCRLLSDVSEAVEALAALRSSGPEFRRAVMVRLRDMGYNAGVCKSRWESTGNLVSGSYEYIDVVAAAAAEGTKERRYIVDLCFAPQFEVARAEEVYAEVVSALPEVAVAPPEQVRQVVRTVGKAARRSLKVRGLHVPPWRKGSYMMAKWLGPYRRTTKAVSGAAVDGMVGGGEAKCRAVGFTAAAARVALC